MKMEVVFGGDRSRGWWLVVLGVGGRGDWEWRQKAKTVVEEAGDAAAMWV